MVMKRGVRSDRQSCTVGAGRCAAVVVGAGAAVGAFLVSGITSSVTAPQAHADFEDVVVQPIVDAIDHAVSLADPGLLSAGVDPGIAADSLGSPAAAAASDPTIAFLPLKEPAVDLLIDVSAGGPSVPVIVDTGSSGLVLPWQDVSPWQEAAALLNHPEFVSGTYAGGAEGEIHYSGLEVPTTVTLGDAGNQVTTGQTNVIAAFSSWDDAKPTWWEQLLNIKHLISLQDAFSSTSGGSAVGVLGLGPNAPGPGPIVTTALPGELRDGELISVYPDHASMSFGSAENLDIGGGNYSSGAPLTDVLVQIDGGPMTLVQATFDSGGGNGDIPSSLLAANETSNGYLLPGTEVSVYNTNDQLLYSYTTDASDLPRVTSDNTMNTGLAPFYFAQGNNHGVYIGNSGTLGIGSADGFLIAS